MNFETKYKVCLIKAYFDKGNQMFSIIKYLFVAPLVYNPLLGFLTTAIYVVLAFVVGYVWYRKNWIRAEIEVSNRFNIFVKEMRDKVVHKKGNKL